MLENKAHAISRDRSTTPPAEMDLYLERAKAVPMVNLTFSFGLCRKVKTKRFTNLILP
jgi:hypothetical protein